VKYLKVIHQNPGNHSVFGLLKSGQIISVDDKFNPGKGDLFASATEAEYMAQFQETIDEIKVSHPKAKKE
jgi:hypothetical protein